MEHIERAQVEDAKDTEFNPLSPGTKSDVNPPIDEKNLVNVPSNDN